MNGTDFSSVLSMIHRNHGLGVRIIAGRFELVRMGVVKKSFPPRATIDEVRRAADEVVNWDDSGVVIAS